MPTFATRLLAAALLIASAASAAADPVQLARSTPYAEGSNVTEAVRKECQLTTELATFVQEAAGESVTLVDAPSGARVLKMKITHVLGVGGPFTPKSLAVEGELVEGGKTVGTFRARRNTGGPTCAALSRCAKALGKDVAQWLAAPAMDAKLGDAR